MIMQAVDTKKIRSGKGKWRNRRYVTRKGPMVIFNEDNGIKKAFRNIPGVDCSSVHSLNLLQLAPGGHMGRFCIWTKGAIEQLYTIFGTVTAASTVKGGWKVPRAMVTNSDASRLVNDGAVQSIINAPKEGSKKYKLKKNPLKNLGAMLKLNPYFAEVKKAAVKATATKKPKTKTIKIRKARMAFYKNISADSDYTNDEFDAFGPWLAKNTIIEEDMAAE